MVRFDRIVTSAADPASPTGAAWRAMRGQPTWIARACTVAFVLIVGLPLALLVMVAVLVTAVLFAVLWSVHRVLGWTRKLFGPGHGRENVRVIRRD